MKPEESIYKRVKKLLIENPELRDSDRKIIAEIWKQGNPWDMDIRKGF